MQMTDYAAIKTEIALPAYNGMTDAQIVGALNGPTIMVAVDVSVGAIEKYLRLRGLMRAINQFANNPPAGADPVAVDVAFEILGLILSPNIQKLETTDP